MNKILELLLNLSPALESGKTLVNASAWGNVANASHALIIVFGFALVIAKTLGIDIPISDDQLAQLAGGIASVGGTIVAYLNVTTSGDKGFKK
jgi:uncharacterized membrane protein YjfL (UPF0719 family)